MDGIRASSLDVWLLRGEEILGAPACQSFEGATEISGASPDTRICLAIPDSACQIFLVAHLRRTILPDQQRKKG
jgi:hypothetical protein